MSKKNSQELARTLTSLLEQNADEIRSRWINEMQQSGLLASLSPKEIEDESKAIYHECLLCLKTGSYESAQRYAANVAKKGVLASMTVEQIIAGFLILRDLYGRFVFENYHKEPEMCSAIIGVYEPVARKILNVVASAFVTERESVIKQQEVGLRLLVPIVSAWEGIAMVPLIGILDSSRAKQLTESVLENIMRSKTEVIVMDISGITAIDTKVASHILRTIQAVRLMGSEVVITGIRPDVAVTLVTLGIDLSNIVSRSTLREGLEYAYAKLGLKLTKT
ncbi:MAG: STAS domain-containing protein [Candidatus Atabeyarchaeum deiterrae]